MKKIFQILAFVLLMSPFSYAQTPLSQGDIAFLSLNLDGTDDSYAFILLKDIDASTSISFTDQGWNDGGGGFQTFTGEATWTWISGTAMTCGTVVSIQVISNTSWIVSAGSISGGFPTLSNIGDQIFAFTGTIASPNIIAGIHSNIVAATTNDANWDGSCTSNQTSALPDVLTNGVNAIRLHASELEQDNWRYNCAVVSGPVATVRAAINNIANWISNDATPFSPAAPPCTWAVTCASPCNNPNVPTVTPSLSLVTPGGSSTLNISGSLNDATQWAIYSGSCGGTLIGTTTSSTFAVNPSVTTTYFVRGEGGCVVPGSCGPATIAVSSATPTTLIPGNLAFIGINHDGADDYAFILLKDISEVTSISFTDHGWDDATGFSNHIGEAVWTWTSGAALTCGTVITITTNPSLSASIGSVSGGIPVISNIGDQIFAFQGSTSSPSFIAGIHSNIEAGITNNANWDGSAATNVNSALPNVLMNGVNAIRLHSSEVEHDNWRYNCSVVSGSSTTVGAAINNIANWTSDDINPYSPVAPACSWSIVCCDEPSVPTLTASTPTVCPGNSSTLTITGSLNNATQWAIYSGSCGGTLVGTTTTSSFIVTPSGNTSYFVRGEGGCVIPPGTCGSATVNVSLLDNAAFNYSAASYCVNASDPTPTITGVSGGIFTASPLGLSINPSTGEVNISASSIGVYSITYATAGACSGSSNVSFEIGDAVAPSAVCTPFTVNLNTSGNGTLTAANINGGSTDNCGTVSLSASQTAFTCANIGTVNVTLTVTDGSGNTSTCLAVVTVVAGPPITGTDVIISCNPITWINGVTYTASNNTATYAIVGGAANGCDSVVTLNLTINSPATGTAVHTACGSFTWTAGNGMTYTASNISATHTIVGGAANGCDSVVTLNLTITNVGMVMNVSTTNVSATGTDVTWDALPAASGFVVEYRVFPGVGPWLPGATAGAGATMASLSGLTQGTTYEVQVTASCSGVAGMASSPGIFTTTSVSCSNPMTLSVSSNVGNSVTLSWTAVPLAGWYEFRYKETSSSTWINGGTLGGAATSKIFSSLMANTSYDFEGRTYCPDGSASPWSTTLTVTTNALSGCALPPAIMASTVNGTSATLTWPAVSGAAWYAFRYKPQSSSIWINGGSAMGTATTKTFTGLTVGTAYDFEALTNCANGVPSAWGAIVVTTTALAGCELPPVLNMTAQAATTSSITISWPAVSGASWYAFQYKESSSSTWINGGSASGSATTKTFIGLMPGTSYDFQARTYCSTGLASAWSTTATHMTMGGGSSLVVNDTPNKVINVEDKALSASHTTNVYPNPATDKVNVEIFMETASDNTAVRLLDMSGRLVREISAQTETGVNTIAVDMRDIADGMYTMMVYQNGNLLHTAKVKKN